MSIKINKMFLILIYAFCYLNGQINEPNEKDIFEEIEGLYKQNIIHKEEMIRNKLYAILNYAVPKKHPKIGTFSISPLVKGTPKIKCLSSEIADIYSNIDLLSQEEQEIYYALFDRPTDHPGGYDGFEYDPAATILTWVSSDGNFLIHYTVDDANDATNAIPVALRTDTDDHGQNSGTFNTDNAPDLIENYAALLVDAYNFFVTQMQFETPIDDGDLRVDAYVLSVHSKITLVYGINL